MNLFAFLVWVSTVLNLPLSDLIMLVLQQLHWLPVESRIAYKLCLILNILHTNWAPQYLADLFRQLHSPPVVLDSATYVKPCTRTKFGDRGFRCAEHVV